MTIKLLVLDIDGTMVGSSNEIRKPVKLAIEKAQEQNIKVIISSPYFTAESADLVARQTGAKVVVLATSVGADKSIKNYFDLFDYNIKKLVDVLK